jgi:dynamin family protein
MNSVPLKDLVTPPSPEEVADACEAIAAAVEAAGDPRVCEQAAEAIRGALKRIGTGTAQVLVVGEKKSGKSSLVNSLAEWRDLVPVDADVATNVHIEVGYAGRPEVMAYLENAADPLQIGLDDIAAFAALDPQTGQAARDDVRYVTVGIPSPLLEAGLTFVDTPGVGGLLAGHAHITRAMLRQADALIFVTSAAGEFTKSALAFLAEATERISTVFFVLAQVDMHSGWPKVLERNRQLLAEHAPRFARAPWFAVSNRAEYEALAAAQRGDQELARSRRELSGCAPLRSRLRSDIAERAFELRIGNALGLAQREVEVLIADGRQRVRMFSLDPALAQDLAERRQRLARLEADNAQWTAELSKGVREFDRELRLSLQRSVNDIRAMAETKIAAAARAEELSQIPADLHAAVTGAGMDLSLTADSAFRRVLRRVQDKIGEVDTDAGTSLVMPDRLSQAPVLVPTAHDADGFWAAVERAAPALGLGAMVGSVLAGLTGGVLLPVIAGVGAMATLSHRRKSRDALIRARADATRYLNRVLSEMSTEYPPEIGAFSEAVGNQLRTAISQHLAQQRRDLESQIAEQQSYLQTAEERLDQDRARAQLQLDGFLELRDSCAKLEFRLGPVAKKD